MPCKAVLALTADLKKARSEALVKAGVAAAQRAERSEGALIWRVSVGRPFEGGAGVLMMASLSPVDRAAAA